MEKEFKEWLINDCGLRTNDIIYLAKGDFRTAQEMFKAEKEMKKELNKIFSKNRKPSKKEIESAIYRAKNNIRKNINENVKNKLKGKLPQKTNAGLSVQDRRKAKEIAENFHNSWIAHKNEGLSNDEIWKKLNYKKKQWTQTEAADAVNSQFDFQMQSTQYEATWNAILDSRTCKKCRRKNGSKITNTLPPLHPYCRCTIKYKLPAS